MSFWEERAWAVHFALLHEQITAIEAYQRLRHIYSMQLLELVRG